MSEFPSWMNPAHLADARAADGSLPKNLQEIIYDLSSQVITALHAGYSEEEIFFEIGLRHPEAIEALEALDEIPPMEETICLE